MKDLLKEAIADAKAVRETALANAKLALEEAFTPRLQSMLSAKLSEELDDDAEMTNEWGDEGYADNNKRFDEGEDDHETNHDEPEEDDDLDLEEIIRELEEEEDENTDSMYEEGMDDEDEMDEDIDINEIIRSLSEEEDSDEDEMHKDSDEDEEDSDEDEMDEDIDINEIIRSLSEEEDSDEDEMHKDSGELEEAYSVIRFLKSKINEVNLLNAKLLYSNKLFRNFSLNESQKMKVIENFDRAYNLREVKLVYSTLAEGFKIPSTKKVVKESFASKPVASTKPAGRIISEGTELSNRFKKLAGLK